MKIVILSFVLIFIISCTKTDQEIPVQETQNCITTDLSIDQSYQYLYQNHNPLVAGENPIWGWKRTGNDLIIKSKYSAENTFLGYMINVFFFKIENNCVNFIKMTQHLNQDCVQIFINEFGETTTDENPEYTYTENNFVLQEWSENTKIVGKYTAINTNQINNNLYGGEFKFWVNFDASNELY